VTISTLPKTVVLQKPKESPQLRPPGRHCSNPRAAMAPTASLWCNACRGDRAKSARVRAGQSWLLTHKRAAAPLHQLEILGCGALDCSTGLRQCRSRWTLISHGIVRVLIGHATLSSSVLSRPEISASPCGAVGVLSVCPERHRDIGVGYSITARSPRQSAHCVFRPIQHRLRATVHVPFDFQNFLYGLLETSLMKLIISRSTALLPHQPVSQRCTAVRFFSHVAV